MNEIWSKRRKIAAHLCWQATREPIFSTFARQGDSGYVDEVTNCRKGWIPDGGRIDSHRNATVEQVADKEIQRLVRAVTSVIIIAAEKCDAKIRRLHKAAG